MTATPHVTPTRQLQPLDMVAPGSMGLNLEMAGTILDPRFALTANNAYIDNNGRLAARAGFTNATITSTAPSAVKTVFEYNAGAGVYQKLVAWDGGAANNVTDPVGSSIAGTASLASGRWYFQNFNNKAIAFQSGQRVSVYSSGTPVLNLIGTAPVTNGVGACAFGRVWAVGTDNQTLNYSGLLDETDWTSASSGLIDMRTVWADGTDQITAVFHFNAALVVCGMKHIVMFTDGRGSQIGLDPTQAYVFDVVLGTGCLSQWTVDYIGESDVVYLSPTGVQSLQRLTTERSNPIANLSKNVRTQLIAQLVAETPSLISGVYYPLAGFYILSYPSNKLIYCFDMKRRYVDDANDLVSRVTTWTSTQWATAPYTMSVDHLGILYIPCVAGDVCTYAGNSDHGATYSYQWISGWLNLGEEVAQRVKMLKRLSVLVYASGGTSLQLSWSVDFGRASGTATLVTLAGGVISQYGLGQYGVSQYGGGAIISLQKYPARARGQYFQVGLTAAIGNSLSLQQAQLATKIGRVN